MLNFFKLLKEITWIKKFVLFLCFSFFIFIAIFFYGSFVVNRDTDKIIDNGLSVISVPQSSSSKTSSLTSETKNNLTGLSIEEEYKNKRPIAIMINNLDQAQPLLGVCQADIMYECMVEGAITRIMAVFKNPYNISMIGSIRSARPYFINIANGLNAIYVHIGGSEQALEMLSNGVIDAFNLGSYPEMMWRDQSRRVNLGYEHSAVTSGEKLYDGISSSNTQTDYTSSSYVQSFGENSPVLNGKVCNKLNVTFSWYKDTVFEYDSSQDTYLVSQFGKAQTDGTAGVQNSKKNILALYINTYSISDSTLQQMDLIGTGTGFYASRGKVIPIKWFRRTLNSSFEYSLEDGTELIMLPGQSYVCCVPFSGTVEYS